MRLQFLGTGPTEIVKGRGKNKRTNTCGLIEEKDTIVIIGLTKFFRSQIEDTDLDPEDIDAFLLSHGHNDQTDGVAQLRRWLSNNNYNYRESPLPVYCEEETWQRLNEDFDNVKHLEYNQISPEDEIEIGDLNITPFRVDHSRDTDKYPAVGFNFGDDLTWCEDTSGIPEDNEHYFDNVTAVALDGAMWFGEDIFNHFNIEDTLQFMKDKDVDKLYIIQAGRTYPQYDDAMQKINQRWEELNGKADAILTYDDMEVQDLSSTTNTDHNTKKLSGRINPSSEGLRLVPRHAKLIDKGSKNLIIRESKREDKISNLMYLVGANLALGTIKLKEPERISLEEFSELSEKHRITKDERERWWPNKRYLYAYEFDYSPFENPKKIKQSGLRSEWLEEIGFVDAVENIESIEEYKPSKLDNDVLKDDFRILITFVEKKMEKGEW